MVTTLFQRIKNGMLIVQQACTLMVEHPAFFGFAALLSVSYAVLFGLLGSCGLYLVYAGKWTEVMRMPNYVQYHGSLPPGVFFHVLSLFLLTLIAHRLWINFLELAISRYAAAVMHHETRPGMAGSLLGALGAIGRLVGWLLINMTVGLALSIISGGGRKTRPPLFDITRQLLGSILATAWRISTFLVLQVIAHENKGPIDSIKRSFTLIKKTFGESLSANFIFSLFYSAVSLLTLLALTCVAGVLQSSPLLVCTAVLLVCGAAYASSVITVARIIFKTSMYFYAQDEQALGFDRTCLASSFVQK